MKVFVTVLLLMAALCAYPAYSFLRKVRISRTLVERAVPYQLKGERGVSVLVLGDSTAVGVGAENQKDTLAALLSDRVHATQLDNFAVSGARVRDLAQQMTRISREKYHYILIGIGANDVIRFGNAENVAQHLSVLLAGLPVHDHLIVYMAGNVGATQLFPKLMNPQYTARTLRFHTTFNAVVTAASGTYINLYTPPESDPFLKNPEMYIAEDGLHPTSAGYKLWFERISAALDR